MIEFRQITFLTVVAITGGLLTFGVYNAVLNDRELAQTQDEKRAITIGVGQAINALFEGKLENLVVMPGKSSETETASAHGYVEFRGALAHNGDSRPFFGVIERLCSTAETSQLDQKDCWQLKQMALNGETVPIADMQQSSEEATMTASAQETAQSPDTETLETATVSIESPGGNGVSQSNPEGQTLSANQVEQPLANTSEASAPESPSSVESPPENTEQIATGATPSTESNSQSQPESSAVIASHMIKGSEVNLRDGPGRAYNAIAVGTYGLKLSLQETTEDWGRFIIMEGDDAGREAWVFMALTDPL